ncbi:MAG TPA: hypothetical protein VM223_05175, partial [Planctomycetota bacterium]|nr:hypothetical protein [Planctomycetota bacterium]
MPQDTELIEKTIEDRLNAPMPDWLSDTAAAVEESSPQTIIDRASAKLPEWLDTQVAASDAAAGEVVDRVKAPMPAWLNPADIKPTEKETWLLRAAREAALERGDDPGKLFGKML